MSHTPTPWTWAKWDDEPVPCIIGPEGDERICEMNGNEDAQANVELIVKAVNSHQAMKEALTGLTEHAAYCLEQYGFPLDDSMLMLALIDQANRALTLANGRLDE